MKLVKIKYTGESKLQDTIEEISNVGIKIYQHYLKKMDTIRALIKHQCICCTNQNAKKNKYSKCEYCVYYDILKETYKE